MKEFERNVEIIHRRQLEQENSENGSSMMAEDQHTMSAAGIQNCTVYRSNNASTDLTNVRACVRVCVCV